MYGRWVVGGCKLVLEGVAVLFELNRDSLGTHHRGLRFYLLFSVAPDLYLLQSLMGVFRFCLLSFNSFSTDVRVLCWNVKYLTIWTIPGFPAEIESNLSFDLSTCGRRLKMWNCT